MPTSGEAKCSPDQEAWQFERESVVSCRDHTDPLESIRIFSREGGIRCQEHVSKGHVYMEVN